MIYNFGRQLHGNVLSFTAAMSHHPDTTVNSVTLEQRLLITLSFIYGQR